MDEKFQINFIFPNQTLVNKISFISHKCNKLHPEITKSY